MKSLSKLELLHNELITAEQLEELEQSEYVKSVEFLGQSVFHDSEWYSVTFNNGNDIDVYVSKSILDETINDAEINIEKVEKLMQMGKLFRDLNDVVDWNYINDAKIQINTKKGIYYADKVNGTLGTLIKINEFTM